MDIKWEGLDKLQDNLEKAATLDDIKRVVRHQEKPCWRQRKSTPSKSQRAVNFTEVIAELSGPRAEFMTT